MSSTDDKQQPSFSIQNIISKLEYLKKQCEEEVGPPKQTTDGTNTTEADNDATKDKEKDDEGKKSQKEVKIDDTGRKNALHELGKLCKELDYMLMSLQKLKAFEDNVREPLDTLGNNVMDILDDLRKLDLPKQVHNNLRVLINNLRVLRNNINGVKITIPAQNQMAGLNSEGTQGLQTTVATGDAGDLPHLYSESKEEEDIFARSYYFKEIKGKYESLDTREKLCLLCFAIFPENAVIKKRFLRFWWVGENLLSLKSGQDEKEVLNATLSRYVEKRLIEPILKKNKLEPRSYKMNPIVRSCLIKFAKEARFFDYDSEGKPIMDFSSCNKACMMKSEGASGTAPWFSDYLNEIENDREQRRGTTLSVNQERLQIFFNFPDPNTLNKASKQFDKLQTLFNLSKQFPALPVEWLLKMTGLKVLYLGKWETLDAPIRYIELEEDFLKGLKNMKNLRLLSLQGISGVRTVPMDLCKLENLRILDLRACYNLEKLPDGIGSLKKLTYLDLSECYLFHYMPKQLNQLAELEVLKGFVIVDVENSCTLSDLSKLKNLRKLSIYVKTTNFDIDAADKALSKLARLEKLKIAWRPGGILVGKEDSTYYNGSKWQSKTQVRSGSSAAKTSNEKQNVGVSQQDSGKDRDDFEETINVVLAANKLMSLRKMGKRRDLKGLEKLVKLDLQCFPRSAPPKWLRPLKMASLRNLSIRGGKLGHLNHEGTTWEVDTLRLKFLKDFNTNWKELHKRFPRLIYLDIDRSPGITFCPCDVDGVWRISSEQTYFNV